MTVKSLDRWMVMLGGSEWWRTFYGGLSGVLGTHGGGREHRCICGLL